MGRVLVAEDNPEICQLLAIALRREGIEVDCVSNGRDALEHLAGGGYDVLVLDLMMPVLSGFDVIDEIARMALEQRPLATIVITAGTQQLEDLNPEVVTAVLSKPFDVLEVGRIITGLSEDAATASG